MALSDTITVTVDAVALDHKKVWDSAFAKEIDAGNTEIRKCPITGGTSKLRISHSEQKGVKRHLLSLTQTTKDATSGTVTDITAHLVLTHPSDDTSFDDATVDVAQGLCDLLDVAGFKDSLMLGEM